MSGYIQEGDASRKVTMCAISLLRMLLNSLEILLLQSCKGGCFSRSRKGRECALVLAVHLLGCIDKQDQVREAVLQMLN
jgi:hypothetical protein